MKNPTHIAITGASSGLGAALTLAYAKPSVFLSLQGRNAKRLEDIAAKARKQGAIVYTNVADVRNQEAMESWLLRRDDALPVDLVIANAGISANTSGKQGDAAVTKEVIETNVLGVANTLHPLIPRMIMRQQGQLALMSSLASYYGAPNAAAYCASKAAVRVYGEALRASLSMFNIDVNVICPGFIRTPLTNRNNFFMPFLVAPDKAAVIIKNGLLKNKKTIAFPFGMVLLARIYALLVKLWPFSLIERAFARLPDKTL